MKMFEVWKINERGIYELVTTTFEPKLAGKIKMKLINNGVFAQVCEHGKNHIVNNWFKIKMLKENKYDKLS